MIVSPLPPLRRVSLTVLLLCATSLSMAQASAPAAGGAVRAEVAKPLQTAQDLLKVGKALESLAELRVAEEVGSLTPYERYVIDRTRAVAALKANEPAIAAAAFGAALSSGLTPAADRPSMLEAQSRAAYQARQYPLAVTALRAYAAEGGQDAGVRALLPNALYLAGDYAAAAKELEPQLAADEAAKRKSSEAVLKLYLSTQVKLNDEAGVVRALERQAVAYPKPEVWAQLISRIISRPGFADSLLLDAGRLKQATGSLNDEGSVLEMAALALEAGLPTEAQNVLDTATKAGVIGAGANAAETQKLRDRATRGAAKEAAQMAGDRAAAQSAKDGNALTLVGPALVALGKPEDGAKALADGLARGGVKRPEEARLHLGVALWRAGKLVEAQQAFDSVKGNDGGADLARLWKAWIRSQS